MIISHCVIPPGGWQFTQGKILLIAETFDLLVANVKSHRINNGIPQGNIVVDIETQIAANHPQMKRNNVLA